MRLSFKTTIGIVHIPFRFVLYVHAIHIRLASFPGLPREREREGLGTRLISSSSSAPLFLCVGSLSVTQDIFPVGPHLPVPGWSHHAPGIPPV